MAEKCSRESVCVCMFVYHVFFVCAPISGHLGCFSILVIVNNAAVNIVCRNLFDVLFSFLLDKYLEVKLEVGIF